MEQGHFFSNKRPASVGDVEAKSPKRNSFQSPKESQVEKWYHWLRYTAKIEDDESIYEYAKLFADNKVTDSILVDLSEHWLDKMGITAVGDQMRILKAANKERFAASSASSSSAMELPSSPEQELSPNLFLEWSDVSIALHWKDENDQPCICGPSEVVQKVNLWPIPWISFAKGEAEPDRRYFIRVKPVTREGEEIREELCKGDTEVEVFDGWAKFSKLKLMIQSATKQKKANSQFFLRFSLYAMHDSKMIPSPHYIDYGPLTVYSHSRQLKPKSIVVYDYNPKSAPAFANTPVLFVGALHLQGPIWTIQFGNLQVDPRTVNYLQPTDSYSAMTCLTPTSAPGRVSIQFKNTFKFKGKDQVNESTPIPFDFIQTGSTVVQKDTVEVDLSRMDEDIGGSKDMFGDSGLWNPFMQNSFNLNLGSSFNSMDAQDSTFGYSSLHWGCGLGKKDMCLKLIEQGANINLLDNQQCSPLYWAVYSGSDDIVELLLEKGAQVNVANKEGYTPLHVAADRCDPNIALALIKKGAVVNAKTNKHYTPLHFAAANGSIELAEILLQHGADINTTDSQKETPLHWAYLEEMIDMIKYLVEHGANAELQNEDGLQPHQMNGSSNIIITKPTVPSITVTQPSAEVEMEKSPKPRAVAARKAVWQWQQFGSTEWKNYSAHISEQIERDFQTLLKNPNAESVVTYTNTDGSSLSIDFCNWIQTDQQSTFTKIRRAVETEAKDNAYAVTDSELNELQNEISQLNLSPYKTNKSGTKMVAQWVWNVEKDSWKPYPPKVSESLESEYIAFTNKESMVGVVEVDKSRYVSFKTMCQHNKRDGGRKRKVKRVMFGWFWKDKHGWREFTREQSLHLEDCFVKRIAVTQLNIGGRLYDMNLLQMCQFNASDRFKMRRIKRIGPPLVDSDVPKLEQLFISSDTYPPYWNLPCNEERRVKLTSNSDIFKRAVQLILETAKAKEATDQQQENIHVEEIVMLQDPKLWKSYIAEKNVLRKRLEDYAPTNTSLEALESSLNTSLLDRSVNEYYLFHPIDPSVAAVIANDGFNEKTRKAAFTSGLQFSDSAAVGSSRALLISRVILGDMFTSKDKFEEYKDKAPQKGATAQGSEVVYDSVIRETEMGRDVMVYDHARYYPEFIVCIK